jgi:acetylornithine deacetylase/succinyl-diaminopimelate desuccinylase-like protein
MAAVSIDRSRALGHLLDLLAVEGLSGHEGKVAAAVRAKLLAAGCRPAWMRHDDVHQRLTGFEIGNLIVRLPGTGRKRGGEVAGGGEGNQRRLFMGHLDTVPLCRGAKAVRRGNRIRTSNVGVVRGGEATNQVTDYVFVRGESRSHRPAFIDQITGAYRAAFENAAAGVTDDRGHAGSVEFRAERDYDSFRMANDSPPVELAMRAAAKLRLDPRTRIANGGLDANYLNAKGVPTVTLGAGQHSAHTVDEYVDLREFWNGCRLLVAIATAPA